MIREIKLYIRRSVTGPYACIALIGLFVGLSTIFTSIPQPNTVSLLPGWRKADVMGISGGRERGRKGGAVNGSWGNYTLSAYSK
eukprot:799273-Amorphochlora_amoeboformis.AAC.1